MNIDIQDQNIQDQTTKTFQVKLMMKLKCFHFPINFKFHICMYNVYHAYPTCFLLLVGLQCVAVRLKILSMSTVQDVLDFTLDVENHSFKGSPVPIFLVSLFTFSKATRPSDVRRVRRHQRYSALQRHLYNYLFDCSDTYMEILASWDIGHLKATSQFIIIAY